MLFLNPDLCVKWPETSPSLTSGRLKQSWPFFTCGEKSNLVGFLISKENDVKISLDQACHLLASDCFIFKSFVNLGSGMFHFRLFLSWL